MKPVILAFCIITSGLFVVKQAYSQSNGQSDSLTFHHKLHKHPFPLWIGNIKIGTTTDSMIMKRFGSGIVDSTDGHGGARYFIDQKRQVLLRTVIGVDRYIEEASLSVKDYPFDFVDSITSFPANAITSGFSISSKTESNIVIGMTGETLKKLLGTPNRKENNSGLTTLYYEDSNVQWSQVIFYQATFTFRNDKLIRITIFNGE